MREILFKGKRIFDGGWVYGFAYKQYSAAKVEEWYIRAFETDYLVVPETVCQFTGLTDNNGRKVFQGDIVKYRNDIRVIIYDNITLCFEMCYAQCYSSNWNCNCGGLYGRITANKKVEVIGNIYDNPELLEV